MRGYYADTLSGERLRRCYELAHPRLRRYLEAEIEFVLTHLAPTDRVLELGCGYGRVTVRLAEVAEQTVGIDNAADSIALARRLHGRDPRCEFMTMDASDLTFEESEFDAVVCVQNGICAFGVDHRALLRQALRVTRPGGQLLFSSYAAGFWDDRLRWFEAQAAEGLVGPIDHARTGAGRIVCEDGFCTGQMTPDQFVSLCAGLGLVAEVSEVDGSSVFCRVVVPGSG
ncbi:methyltransferase domain-containing protein [bacterium]|nr:methyltransferase domain-containing protein [bacterium]